MLSNLVPAANHEWRGGNRDGALPQRESLQRAGQPREQLRAVRGGVPPGPETSV